MVHDMDDPEITENPAPAVERRMYSVTEVATLVGVCPKTVYGQIKRGTFPIPHRQIGGVIRFPCRFVDAFVEGDLCDVA